MDLIMKVCSHFSSVLFHDRLCRRRGTGEDSAEIFFQSSEAVVSSSGVDREVLSFKLAVSISSAGSHFDKCTRYKQTNKQTNKRTHQLIAATLTPSLHHGNQAGDVIIANDDVARLKVETFLCSGGAHHHFVFSCVELVHHI